MQTTELHQTLTRPIACSASPALKTIAPNDDILPLVSEQAIHHAISQLPAHGQLVKDRAYRQIWRVATEQGTWFVKFYPHAENRWKNLARGSSARREARRLQWLADAGISAPRLAGVFKNVTIDGRSGDAVALHAMEPSITLDALLQQHAGVLPDHRRRMIQLLELLTKLDDAGLGHSDLHLGNILLHNDQLYLLDAHAVHRRGLSQKDLLLLGHSANRIATRTDMVRGWRQLRGLERMPIPNRVSHALWRKSLCRSTRINRYFGRLRDGSWRGHFFKRYSSPRAWSRASDLKLTDDQWQQAWETLRQQIDRDALTVIKRTRSGDVLSGELAIGADVVPIIVKRPRRKFWYRAVLEVIRPTRARRAWAKSWSLIFREFPTAWPLLLMQRRSLGYVTDALIVYEKIDAPMLSDVDLDSLPADGRIVLFHRLGRLFRRLEALGLYHWDAKSVNFMIRTDPAGQPLPMLIDVDGIRRTQKSRLPIDRLLRSLRDHPQYTPDDSYHLCRGYAPHARRMADRPKAAATVDQNPPIG